MNAEIETVFTFSGTDEQIINMVNVLREYDENNLKIKYGEEYRDWPLFGFYMGTDDAILSEINNHEFKVHGSGPYGFGWLHDFTYEEGQRPEFLRLLSTCGGKYEMEVHEANDYNYVDITATYNGDNTIHVEVVEWPDGDIEYEVVAPEYFHNRLPFCEFLKMLNTVGIDKHDFEQYAEAYGYDSNCLELEDEYCAYLLSLINDFELDGINEPEWYESIVAPIGKRLKDIGITTDDFYNSEEWHGQADRYEADLVVKQGDNNDNT